jgi:filamentous hemagglutinin family protein
MKKYDVKLTPRSERQAIIQSRVESTKEPPATLWDFRGDKALLPVIVLPVDLPVYRMDNCRTYSEQQDAIAKGNLEKTYFAKGQELSTVQAAQHAILAKLAKRDSTSVSAIQDVLSKEGQREPILITSSGIVVNGNRRLSAMRELYTEDPLHRDPQRMGTGREVWTGLSFPRVGHAEGTSGTVRTHCRAGSRPRPFRQ